MDFCNNQRCMVITNSIWDICLTSAGNPKPFSSSPHFSPAPQPLLAIGRHRSTFCLHSCVHSRRFIQMESWVSSSGLLMAGQYSIVWAVHISFTCSPVDGPLGLGCSTSGLSWKTLLQTFVPTILCGGVFLFLLSRRTPRSGNVRAFWLHAVCRHGRHRGLACLGYRSLTS